MVVQSGVGNPEDRISHNEAQLITVLVGMSVICGLVYCELFYPLRKFDVNVLNVFMLKYQHLILILMVHVYKPP